MHESHLHRIPQVANKKDQQNIRVLSIENFTFEKNLDNLKEYEKKLLQRARDSATITKQSTSQPTGRQNNRPVSNITNKRRLVPQ